MSLWNTIFLFLIFCLLIYVYFHHKMNLFQLARIPSLKPWPIVGNMIPIILRKISVPDFIMKMYNLNPDAKYVGFYEFRRPVILLRDPELIKLVGIKQFDIFPNRRGYDAGNPDAVMGKDIFSSKYEKWQGMRKSLSFAYTPMRLKILSKLISQQVQDFSEKIFQNAETVEINSAKWIQKNIIDIVNRCNYGIFSNCLKDQNEDLYKFCLRAANMEELETKKQYQLMSSFIWKLFGMSYVDSDVIKYFRNIVESSIAQRENENRPSLTVIDQIINSSDENEHSIEDMTAQAFVFFTASFHTTSTTLIYICYYLATYPEAQEKIYKEILTLQNKYKESSHQKESFDEDDSISCQPTFEDINGLEFLDAFIKETMRTHSNFPLEREPLENFTLPPALPGLEPFTVKPGMLLLMPMEAIHNDPKYIEQPSEFKPERFLKSNDSPLFSFFPFGLGPRKCIGERMATLIIKLFLFHNLIKCNIKTCSRTPIPLTMCNRKFTRIPEKEIWLRLEKRSTQ